MRFSVGDVVYIRSDNAYGVVTNAVVRDPHIDYCLEILNFEPLKPLRVRSEVDLYKVWDTHYGMVIEGDDDEIRRR